MGPAISIRHLSHAYGKVNVLEDLSFEVERGVFFTIIGPNGSGKSTLMRLVSGVLSHGQGEIKIADRSLKTYSGRGLARKIAYVPQTVSQAFPFTVEELVLLGRSPHQGILGMNTRQDYDAAHQAMGFTNVDHLGQRTLDQISGGERQRVFIARAICQDPEIMLLDEPASALDLAHQVMLMDLMDQLKRETGITIVMVSHDINLAAMYSDHMVLLAGGRVVKEGNPHTVLDPLILEEIFGCPFLVDLNPLGNVPRIFPIPGRFRTPVKGFAPTKDP